MAESIRVSPRSNKTAHEPCSMHYMPCKILHSGDAKVKEYFESSVRGSGEMVLSGGEDEKCGSFRGRPMKGRLMTLPLNYEGLVLKEEKSPYSDEEERNLVPKASFDSFCYWNLDNKPTDNDAIYKAFQWIGIANELHGSRDKMEQEDIVEATQTDR